MKGATKGKSNVAFSFEELHKMYETFEAKRIEKAQGLLGKMKMKPDHFCKFLVERTAFCPHKLVDASTNYWLETVSLLDGEMGMTLPGKMEEIPLIFFEALAIVRTARAQARREDKKD